MSKPAERFFYFCTFLTQGSSYLSPRAYGIMHRLHHANTDTEKDPHSPTHDKNLFQMMWRTYKVYAAIYKDDQSIDPKFKKGVPDWPAFDRFASSLGTRLFWVALYVAFYVAFAPYWWMYLLIPIHIGMGPVHGVVVNWFAHKYGYTNFKMDNTSTNLMPWDVFMMGEGLHNNHHKFASRANFGVRKMEFDPSYPIIWLLNKWKIIKLN
jgi:stearoyl-CoA desaturase (delta-9 desaturase)